mmetsp:Transcript_9910/g.13613  ORF Transcript_9910/g.13613 Transcript_9910/m.13613 type:complete len:498 (-) Transcript_9910:187-1680(-)
MEHWTTGECLALFHAVLKFGENNWEDVSKAICKYSKELHRPLDVVDENSNSRNEFFFSPKSCAEKFNELLTQHANNREQGAEKSDESTVIATIANKLRETRMEELRKSIEARESNMKKLKEEMAEISSGAWDALLEAEIKDTENDNAAVSAPAKTQAEEPQSEQVQISEAPIAEAPSKKQKVDKPSEEILVTQVAEVIAPAQPVVPTPPVQLPPSTPKSPILPPPQPKEEPTPMDITPTTSVVEPEPKPAAPAPPVNPPEESPMAESPATTQPDNEKEEEDSSTKKKRKASKQKTKKTPKDKSESATPTPTPSSPVATTPSSAAPSSPIFTPIKLEPEAVKEDMSPTVEVKKEKASKHANKGDTVRTLLDTLKKISAHKYAHVFKQPVSLEEAPDYDEIIKQRMDLSTIKKNLVDGKITTTQEFWRDLLLMFQNAMIYNMKGSEIYNMAVKLKKFSAKEMEPIFAAEEKMRIALQQNQAPGKRTLRSSSSGIPSQKY